MEINNNLKINEYVSITQLKKKLKYYFAEQGNSDFKPSIFAKGLIVSLVMILEELINDCLKSVYKEKSGLYTINKLVLSNLLENNDKYEFSTRYLKKYYSIIRYHESIFFNFNKVITNIEDKHGSKLMVDAESKNIIAYIILSLQYDIIKLSINMVKYAGRKTLNINVLDIVCNYILSNEISNKIKLKLDSINIISNNDDNDEDSEEVDETDVENNNINNINNIDDLENINNLKEVDIQNNEIVKTLNIKNTDKCDDDSKILKENDKNKKVEKLIRKNKNI